MKTAQEFEKHLIKLGACEEGRNFCKGKTAKEAWDTIERGDWLLWWAQKENVDLRTLTKAKGECAKTVYHLMKDERSRKAVDVAIAFGEGTATRKELNAAYAAAAAAYADAADAAAAYADAADAAYVADAYAAAYAAYAADAYAAAAAAYAADAYAAAAAYAATDAAYAAYVAAYADARIKNQRQTADIVRSIIVPDFL